MIELKDGAVAYLPGEWSLSTRSNATYHAHRDGKRIATSTLGGILFIWPLETPIFQRLRMTVDVVRDWLDAQQAGGATNV